MNNKLVNSIKNSVYSVYATSNFRPSYWHEPAEEPFLHVTLGQLIDRAAEVWTDDEAFVSVYENIRLTFKEAREKADKLAAGFLNLGLSSGDVIAVWGSISSDVYLTLLAAARAGLTVAGVQPKGNAPELTHCLRIAKAKALVVIEVENDKNFCDILHEAIPELSSSKPGNLHSDTLPNLKIVITRSSVSFQGTYNFEDICRLASSSGIERVHNLQTITDPDETFIICFTSGSTGTPKAIAKSYHTVINISYETSRMFKMDLKKRRILTHFELYDLTCMTHSIVPTFLFGCTVIFGSGRYDPETSVKVIQNERCSSLVDVPTLYVDIISYVKENGVKLESLEEVFIGGALVTEKLAAEVLSVLNVKRIIHAYGMTESSMIGWHAIMTDDMENISLLQLVKNYEVKVVDNQGRPVPLGMPGELWVRGYSVMKGYIDDEERTAECKTSDGWLKTGYIISNCLSQSL